MSRAAERERFYDWLMQHYSETLSMVMASVPQPFGENTFWVIIDKDRFEEAKEWLSERGLYNERHRYTSSNARTLVALHYHADAVIFQLMFGITSPFLLHTPSEANRS